MKYTILVFNQTSMFFICVNPLKLISIIISRMFHFITFYSITRRLVKTFTKDFFVLRNDVGGPH